MELTPQIIASPGFFYALKKIQAEQSFAYFIREAWKHIESVPLVWNWHLDAMAAHLEACRDSRIMKLLVNCPPGMSKSLVFSVFYPAWIWTTQPEMRFFFASYDQKLSTRDSVRCRTLIESEWYQSRWKLKFTGDQNQKTYYSTVQGGYRMASSVGGHATGEHPDYIVCLPWESRIMTDRGILPIGKIVDDKLAVNVLSFDHSDGNQEWRPIEAHESSPGRPICRVTLTSGKSVELTEDHPVYVVGRGYVSAGKLRQGDKVIYAHVLQRMRQGILREAKSRREVLQPEVLQRDANTLGYTEMQAMRKGFLPSACASSQDEGWNVLFASLSRQFDPWGESSFVSRINGDGVQSLRKDIHGRETTAAQSQDVWGRMSGTMVAIDADRETNRFDLRVLRRRNTNREETPWTKEVLFSPMRQQFSCGADQGTEQSELHTRRSLQTLGVPIGILFSEAQDSQARELPMFSLRAVGEGSWKRPGDSSHRRRQEAQRQREFSSALPDLPRQTQWKEGQAIATCTEVVSSVERAIRIPDKVYNIRVSKNSNYFANGILVHNCDDPNSVKQAESEADRLTVKEWWTLTMATRGISRGARRIAIMQRVHFDDFSALALREGDWEHICLPMRFERDRMKQTSLGWIDPRTEEGVLLAKDQFPEESVKKMEMTLRLELGEYGVSGQMQQRPVPRSGGMFKKHYFANFSPGAPANSRRVRYWDRAATPDGGCYTCGVLMAASSDGRYFVEHVERGQWAPDQRNAIMLKTAKQDRETYGYNVKIAVEQEPGSSGVDAVQSIVKLMAGFPVWPDKVTGPKEFRAEPLAAQFGAGNVYVPQGAPWLPEFEAELCQFPKGKYADQVDAAAGAFNQLTKGNPWSTPAASSGPGSATVNNPSGQPADRMAGFVGTGKANGLRF